jgi:hypothetical protein
VPGVGGSGARFPVQGEQMRVNDMAGNKDDVLMKWRVMLMTWQGIFARLYLPASPRI